MVLGPGSFAVRDERWYLIHYLDGVEELYMGSRVVNPASARVTSI
jgi:hypothetical protein